MDMKNTLLAAFGLLVLALVVWVGYVWFTTGKMPLSSSVSEHPAIAPQKVEASDAEGPMGFLLSVEGRTTTGETVMLFREQIYGDGAIYSINNDLYGYKDSTFTYLPESDKSSFQTIDTGFSFVIYAKDSHNVYCKGSIIKGADAATFHFAPGDSPAADVLSDRNISYPKGQCPNT
jgi:hypothetical protein